MPLIFCNVGWMEKYQGIEGDSLKRGGSYNHEEIGHEVCNFSDSDGTLYGYVQPKGRQIKIENLGGNIESDSVDGITVVWTASPEAGGTVVIGWYKDATVYRYGHKIARQSAIQKANGITECFVTAPSKEATLLPIERRDLIIPRAAQAGKGRGIGQSNVWYALATESESIVNQVQALIKGGKSPTLPDVDLNHAGQEGNVRLVAHLRRERDQKIIAAKKRAVLAATGKLCCESCGFDFHDFYGEIGEGFCEAHHIIPLAKADSIVTTKLEDLAIVCSNCHRIIHRSKPMLSVKSLSQVISQ